MISTLGQQPGFPLFTVLPALFSAADSCRVVVVMLSYCSATHFYIPNIADENRTPEFFSHLTGRSNGAYNPLSEKGISLGLKLYYLNISAIFTKRTLDLMLMNEKRI